MQMRAAAGGLRILEVPVDHRCRQGGVSKVSGNLIAGLQAAWKIVTTFLRLAVTLRNAPPYRRRSPAVESLIMRVLLTGGAGFIGRHVLRELLARGHEVRVLDSLRPDVHAGGKTGPLDGAELQVADVREPAAVERALHGVDAVLHLAAKVGLGVDVGDLPDYASSNDVGTAELLAGMARAGVTRLTLASSMVVYGEGLGLCPEHGAVRPGPRIETELEAGQFRTALPDLRPLARRRAGR